MSIVQQAAQSVQATNAEITCVLTASDTYIERLSMKAVKARPGLVEFVISTQLLSGKNPDEKRVKSRSCIELTRLADIQGTIGKFLQNTGSSDEPMMK